NTLKKFILRSQVSIEEVSHQFCHFGISGTTSTQHLQQIFDTLPENLNELTQLPQGCLMRIPGKLPRYELLLAHQQCQSLWEKLDVHGAPVGASAWQLIDIRAGLVDIDQSLTEQYVPQMINLDLVQGLSFQKGCYPGQEIVARMHYRGKLKRRLYYATAKRDEIAAPGAPLFQPGLSASQDAGQVVSCTWAPDDGIELLAVIPIERQQAGDLHLDAETGPLLHFEPLPYAVPD
ncbi:MAG TPA: folate-binding protein, partial [Gammaproteobacteria bacterium]|nr:folate-binding protein [Gammaproteobacteria bacterium]